VRGALSEGDRIVAVGTHRIVPGQQVRLLDESTLARRGDDGES
ncbi:MAG TPA: efflux RND transporter periplasmic adaptor subunit, partial [Gammaproteobacteria bacterium]|nr:efflux RND transporter periplasmic adaptor subunit [Gammaproteobacteria bacterium]